MNFRVEIPCSAVRADKLAIIGKTHTLVVGMYYAKSLVGAINLTKETATDVITALSYWLESQDG